MAKSRALKANVVQVFPPVFFGSLSFLFFRHFCAKVAICNPFRDAGRYANRAIPRARTENGQQMGLGKSSAFFFSLLSSTKGDTDTYAEIRTKETARLSKKRHLMSHKEEGKTFFLFALHSNYYSSLSLSEIVCLLTTS